MPDKSRLIFFAGSSRKESFNKKLARLAADMAREAGANVTFLDLADYPMPIYNGDLEAEQGLPDNVKTLKQLFQDNDGFFIASPEYNSSIPPLLKNTLDWLSRKETADEAPLIAYQGKVAALCAASPGQYGGLRGLVPLRMMLGNIGVHIVPQQLAVARANDAFDDQGKLKDEQQSKTLKSIVSNLIRISTGLKS